MTNKLKKLTGNVLETSSFLKSVAALKNDQFKSRLFRNNVRNLLDEEIGQLQKQGNISHDWNAILVVEDFMTTGIFNSSFYGKCRLGKFDGTGPAKDGPWGLPAGIYRSTVVDSEIGNGCIIHDTGVLANCVVRDSAMLIGNGSISASGTCTFGNGIEIAVGNETGGRDIVSYADLTIPVAETIARNRSDKDLLKAYKDFTDEYLSRCSAPLGYIGEKAVIKNTGTIEDAFIGDHAVINGAVLIKNCTILATPEEKTEISHGAWLKDSCVQWGSEVTSMAIVDKSVLCEHSHVERHGKVTMSIIGPNSGVAEGEVTSCLLGPFVGFHHQSMLIAGIWPEGKGNVAYGANIGSNHTSKSPDQEIFCGEGLFFGLGSNIKFPSDFTGAPYSIIATGVDTLPQRLEFPFSLVNKPARLIADISPSYNEIFPGWVLSQNIYSVRRNEGKYKKRNKARRSEFEFSVFRPAIIDLMIAARNRLRGAAAEREIYTDSDIPGLGKNYLTEEKRKTGIESYELYIEYYALMRMLERITAMTAGKSATSLKGIYGDATDDGQWEHARKVLAGEGYTGRSVKDNLIRLMEILESVSADTYRSKERDDIRGGKIIPDYADVNTLAGNDSFIKETIEETVELKERIQSIIADI
ncbi:MAG: hypothetical protein CVV44_17155 [Spirochaetae bacterium HGW-Spirochaetae-1]|jgi:hypothetical protein|nr:MAG: hypothetical protein CVV44_17155 [Spirochaetae bacterium HGW-Spirochaetae-1]